MLKTLNAHNDTNNLWDICKNTNISDAYEYSITSVRANLTKNHQLRSIVMIQHYSVHTARPS